jgi:hypothetical protein
MLRLRWRGAAAGATVVVGAATGVVTNLITSRWAIGLAVGLGVLLVVGVALQVALAAGEDPADSGGGADMPSRPAVRQNARGRGHATIIQAGGDVSVKPEDGPASLRGKKKPAP